MIDNIISLLRDGTSPISVQGVKGSFKAFLISQIEEVVEGPIVVITSSPLEAERICNDLRCLLGKNEYPLHQKKRGVYLLPPWDTLPFEASSPYIPIQANRIETLFRILSAGVPPVIVLSIRSFMQRVISKSYLKENTITLSHGKRISPEEIIKRLLDWGFISSGICEEKGDFSSRGGILDVFPPLYEFPIRMEFVGDQIDSLRHFDPMTQRSLVHISEATIIPVREISFSIEARKKAISRLINSESKGTKGGGVDLSLIESIEGGMGFPGIEYMLPFFHDNLETVLDYMAIRPLLVMDEPFNIWNTADEFWDEIRSRLGFALNEGRPLPEANKIYISPDEIKKRLEGLSIINFIDIDVTDSSLESHSQPIKVFIETNDDLRRDLLQKPVDEGIFIELAERINNWLSEGMEVHFYGHNFGQAQRMKDILEEYGVPVEWQENDGLKIKKGLSQGAMTCLIHIGGLSHGFRFEQGRIIIITDEDIFGPKRPLRGRKVYREAPPLTDFEDLKENDLIVHVEHGIGIFRGLSHLNIEGSQGDFLTIEYLGNDRLYIPVYNLNMVHRYVGTEGFIPRLDRLGGKAWERRKKKAKESIRKMAKELLEIYAEREALQGFAFNKEDPFYDEFEKSFEYEETPDQKAAIEDVLRDMARPRPMDRLICGDVGYGKTEVAMRAAFKAVMHGKQVAVLVPTTILAQQHYQTFKNRFQGYPVFIEVLSRFKTKAQQKQIIKGCKNGAVDILIGTHRLLQKDIAFKDLGLLIIDEEHRFGVAHKELLKKISRLVDVIQMSATPIPRTLYMGLTGIRDLSIINTPPPNRLSIRTYISHFERGIIEEAIIREIKRGGQVFFVHNRVQSIQGIAKILKKWLPGVRIAVAHGQLPSAELERVMEDYVNKKIDVLVCTTIIQSGLDIPDANTIIINQADRLGLAEMYQIRGRVGRAGHRAYAYLLIQKGKDSLTQEARKRLQVIQEFSELGAGFKIAQRDLEIRGAGTLLGPSQSGHIDSLGFEMYTSLMRRAVAELRGEPIKDEVEPEINIPEPAYLPDNYIRDTNQRLFFYKRLSSLNSEEEIIETRGELEDRFGRIPFEAENLIEVIKIKIMLKRMGVLQLKWNNGWIDLNINERHYLDVNAIAEMAQKERDLIRLSPEGRISLKVNYPSRDSLFKEIARALKTFEQRATIARKSS